MSMGRRPRHNGDEQDAYSHWRYMLCCLTRAGVIAKTKRRTHKRERRQGKREARDW